MKYKIDTHIHTDESSACGKVKAQDMVKQYIEAGFDTIFVTDHYHKRFFTEITYGKTWSEKVGHLLKGYKCAIEAAKGSSLNVLLGIEIMFEWGDYDFLVYGVDESFLLSYPELYDYSVEDFTALKKEKGFTVIQAHPFRITAQDHDFIDGYEVFNGSFSHESHNDKAWKYAKDKGVLMSAGSDFHKIEDLNSGMLIDKPIKSYIDYKNALYKKDFKSYIAYGSKIDFINNKGSKNGKI